MAKKVDILSLIAQKLTVIDVNTWKYVGRTDLEDTALNQYRGSKRDCKTIEIMI